MTTEDKELLLKDICARLPYGVIIQVKDWAVLDAELKIGHINRLQNDDLELKPYLFPLSSMTEEQKYDFYCRFIENDCDFDDFKKFYLDYGMWHKLITSLDDIEEVIDWFHKNHFDYRGLIHKDLAIDATGLNIY